ncbi:MAG: sugar-binding protein, partial [Citrobacter freundii]
MFVAFSFAQTTSQNYIKTTVTLSDSIVDKSESVQYFDGLGRTRQSISAKATPTGKDIVAYVEYDSNGQVLKSYLPIPVENTVLNIQNITGTHINNYYGIDNAYSENVLDQSPLGRVVESASPGEDWKMQNGHTKTISYSANNSNEVFKFGTTASYPGRLLNSSITFNQYYAANQLSKNTLTDEDGQTSIEYKNSQGQTVLLRRIETHGITVGKPGNPVNATKYADTYYVYNNYGQLVYVIPPLATEQIKNQQSVTTTVLDELCYQYLYDNRNRRVMKKLPGKGWESMVYDRQNRLVAAQDPKMQAEGKWLFTKYDKFGRPIYTGKFSAATREAVQDAVDQKDLNNETTGSSFTTSGLTVYYSKTNAYPATFTEISSVAYYDTYPTGAEPLPDYVMGKPTLKPVSQTYSVNGVVTNRSTRGLPTASYVKTSESNDNRWSKNFNWYDTKARMIGSHSTNHLGGYTKTSIGLDFAGKTIATYTRHKRTSADTEIVIKNRYQYKNHVLEKHYHQVNNNPEELLAVYTYNDIGQLINKKVGGTDNSPLQDVSYSYNIRGWLQGINTDANNALQSGKLFSYKIKYNNADNPDNNPQRYNGSISEIDWNTGGGVKRYGYNYDLLNRLTSAKFQTPGTTVPEISSYDEAAEYDINGNITRLTRSAPTFMMPGPTTEIIDDLAYTYAGNRVTTINDDSNNPSG